MSYRTDFSLVVRCIKNKEKYEELLHEIVKKDLINYAFCEGDYNFEKKEAVFPCYDSVNWYNHVADMVYIAEKFPKMYFELTGIGESFGDFWKEYYHDMDIEECQGEVVFEQPRKVQWTDLVKF